jgi:hypothetical protein
MSRSTTFRYYRRDLAEGLVKDGRPMIPEHDLLLEALVREHGEAGRPDIALEIRRRPRRNPRAVAFAVIAAVLIASAAHAEPSTRVPRQHGTRDWACHDARQHDHVSEQFRARDRESYAG